MFTHVPVVVFIANDPAYDMCQEVMIWSVWLRNRSPVVLGVGLCGFYAKSPQLSNI